MFIAVKINAVTALTQQITASECVGLYGANVLVQLAC